MRSVSVGLAAALILFGASLATPSFAQTAPVPGLVTLTSKVSLAEAEKRLTDALQGAGLMVAVRVDHAAAAQKVSLSLPPTVLIVFGNPRLGTLLMQKKLSAAIDLPLKILLTQEGDMVLISYNDPAWIAARHGIDASDPTIAQIGTALRRFAAAAAG